MVLPKRVKVLPKKVYPFEYYTLFYFAFSLPSSFWHLFSCYEINFSYIQKKYEVQKIQYIFFLLYVYICQKKILIMPVRKKLFGHCFIIIMTAEFFPFEC
jgi:hypothetical protein